MTDKKLQFSRREYTILQMMCEFSYAKYGDQLELYSYFNPTDITSLTNFHDREFASFYSRDFLNWALRKDIPDFKGLECGLLFVADLKNLSEDTLEEATELLQDFIICFDIESEA